MFVRPTRPNIWRLSCAGLLIAADLIEGQPRYHLHTHPHFDADLAYGRSTITAYSTGGGNVWVTPGPAEMVWTGFAPTVTVS